MEEVRQRKEGKRTIVAIGNESNKGIEANFRGLE